MELFRGCHAVLTTADIAAKFVHIEALGTALQKNALTLDRRSAPPAPAQFARPEQPLLVPPQRVPRRGVGSAHGRAALLHSLAHIEFNAWHLALDASAAFPELPDEYHRDWVRVAVEEAGHF